MTSMRVRTARSLAVLALLLAVALVAVAPSGPPADAGEADPNVLALSDGGQFVFWSYGDAEAADVFGTVVIAWLFNPTAINWSSFIPVLGTANFALVEGAVLWVVSDGSQEIVVGADAPAEDGVTPGDDADTRSAVIGPEGGSLTSADGSFTLEVPAGALSDSVTLSVAPVDVASLPESVSGGAVDGPAYIVGPEGVTFATPVNARVTLPPSEGAGLPLYVAFLLPGDALLATPGIQAAGKNLEDLFFPPLPAQQMETDGGSTLEVALPRGGTLVFDLLGLEVGLDPDRIPTVWVNVPFDVEVFVDVPGLLVAGGLVPLEGQVTPDAEAPIVPLSAPPVALDFDEPPPENGLSQGFGFGPLAVAEADLTYVCTAADQDGAQYAAAVAVEWTTPALQLTGGGSFTTSGTVVGRVEECVEPSGTTEYLSVPGFTKIGAPTLDGKSHLIVNQTGVGGMLPVEWEVTLVPADGGPPQRSKGLLAQKRDVDCANDDRCSGNITLPDAEPGDKIYVVAWKVGPPRTPLAADCWMVAADRTLVPC